MPTKIKILSTALTLMLVMASSTAVACSCFRTATDRSRFEQAGHVFTARITSAREVKDRQGVHVEATFSVTEVLKGQPKTLNRLWSHKPFGQGSNSCAVVFSVGEHYILLVDDDGLVEYCSGSKRYNPALEQADVEVLRAIARPKTP